jgi:hypothetical protein
MATAQSDFVDVQLSAAGVQVAGASGTITVTTQHFSYAFTAAGGTRVLTSEWAKTLSKETVNGQKILELTPAVVVNVAQGASVADQPSTLKTEEASLDAQVETQPKSAAVKGSK